MKIVIKKSDNSVVMIADCASVPFDPADYTIHDKPGWDWSLANFTGLDLRDCAFIGQLAWNGTTIAKKA